MMRRFIPFYFRQMMTKFWLGFLVLICFICLAERQVYEGNLSVFVIKMLTDQYLIIYLMTPIFIQCISQIFKEPHITELIRVGRFYRIMLAKWLAIACFSLVFVLSMGIIASLMGIGLELSTSWSGAISEDLKVHLMTSFPSPIEGILLSGSFMVLGFTFIGCTFVTVAHYLSRKGAYGFIIISYIVMIIAFKMPWLEILKYMPMSRFIILHHNFTNSFTWKWMLLIVGVGFVVQFVLVKKWWYTNGLLKYKEPLPGRGLFSYYGRILFAPKSMLVWIVALLLLIISKAMGNREETLQYFIKRFFYGYPNSDIHLFTWLEQLIYVGVPVYLFAAFLQGWLVKRDWQMYIRMRHKRQLMKAMGPLMGLYAVSYVVLTFLLILGAAVLFDKAFVVDGSQLTYLLCMKILEISTLIGLLFLLFVLTNKVTLPFVCVVALYVLNYLPYGWASYNVAGLGQLARIEEMNQSMLAMVITGVVYLVMLFFLISCSYKKYFVGR